MAESIYITQGSRQEQYEGILPQILAVISGEPDPIANMANIAACLYAQFQWLWVGFYRVSGDELVLGPFQGPLACTRIRKGKGVCGQAWEKKQTLIVPDVLVFPGHIACSSESRSEIVVPLLRDGEVWGVLDADSEHPAHFGETDRYYLEKLAASLNWPAASLPS